MTEASQEPLREGLAPVIGDGARVLVLGSFPSERSLATGEYYANRGNRATRIDAVQRHGIALWDVVHSCRRAGSMDVKIDRKTLRVNDFGPFLAQHSSIERVFVNGLTARELFERHVDTALPVVRLPSSSGALPMSFANKLVAWRRLADR